MSKKLKILFAEDDLDLGSVLKMFLEMSGFHVEWFTDGVSAVEAFEDVKPDICVLDVMIPKLDGFEVAKKLKQINDVPFLFLTARKQKEDRLKGLILGADDYITKPFEADELVLRIKNILKRVSITDTHLFKIGDYQLDVSNFTLIYNKQSKTLTEKECRFLEYLYINRNTLIKRDEILAEIWGENDYFLGRSMDVFLARVKKYLQEDINIRFENVRGVGFRFLVK